MTIADELISKFNEDTDFLPFGADDVARAFAAKLEKFDFDGVRVDHVEIDLEGDIIVTFADFEGDEMDVLFQVDEEDDAVSAILVEDDDMGEDDEVLLVDLTGLNPSVIEVDSLGVRYVNLTDLSWLNKSTMTSILQAGEIGMPSEPTAPAAKKQDAFGNVMNQDIGTLEGLDLRIFLDGKTDGVYELDERTAVVVRGGKRVKLPVVRRRRKRRLTSKQRQGIRKGVLKRKAKKSQINRARKKSSKLRGRLKLKRAAPGSRKRFKVSGS